MSVSVIEEKRANSDHTREDVGPNRVPFRPLFVSALIMTGLLGVLLGMFVGHRTGSSPPAAAASTAIDSDEQWLGPADSPFDTDEDQKEESGDSLRETIVTDEGTTVEKGTVQSGVPVIRSLMELGLSTQDAQIIINALTELFDFRRARPGHVFELTYNTQGIPVRFRYEASATEIFEATRQADGFVGKQIPVMTQKSSRVFAGTITSSLFGTMRDLGAKPSLAAMVADILSQQIDFLKEQRPGDTFRVMVEEETLNGEFLRYGPVLALEYNGVKAGERRLYRFEETDNNAKYYNEKMISAPSSAMAIPLYYSRMSSPFGYRIHPVLKRRKLHNGVDFSAPIGTPIWACTDGVISYAGYKGANGNLVSIRHDGNITSHYAHLQRIAKGIRPGVKVRRKQVIGYVGSTGRSTGPHLHWGLKVRGKFVDPLKFRVVPGTKIGAKHRPRLSRIITRRNAFMSKAPIEPPKGEILQLPEGDEPLGDY